VSQQFIMNEDSPEVFEMSQTFIMQSFTITATHFIKILLHLFKLGVADEVNNTFIKHFESLYISVNVCICSKNTFGYIYI
jgi:hypothetical protein